MYLLALQHHLATTVRYYLGIVMNSPLIDCGMVYLKLAVVNRVKDKVRRLARHHKVYLTDVNKLHDNVERARLEAKSALEAKKRMLQQSIERRFEEAMEAVDDEIQAKKLPLDQASSDIKRSSAVLDAALETLEDKLKEPQHDFIQRFVPMIEVCNFQWTPGRSQLPLSSVLRCVFNRLIE